MKKIEFLYDHFNAEYEQELKQLILQLELKEDNPEPDDRENQILADVYSRVKEVTHPHRNEDSLRKPLYKILRYRIAAAAVLIICLSFGITL